MGIMDEALAATGGGGHWAKFENVGDTVQGEIVSMSVRQASDFTTKLPAVSTAGKPKMQLVVGIKVAEPAEDDDGVRLVDINLWGIQRDALDAAVAKLGRGGEIGDLLRVKYLGKQKPAYTSSLAHAYEYSMVRTTREDAPAQDADTWAQQVQASKATMPRYGDDTPF